MPNTKVHELAKELNISSKELLEKINAMGIEAKSHMSVLADIDVIAVRNTILKNKSHSETKIVKAAPRKSNDMPKKQEAAVAEKLTERKTKPKTASEERKSKPEAERPKKTVAERQTEKTNAERQTTEKAAEKPHQNRPQAARSTQKSAGTNDRQDKRRTDHAGQKSESQRRDNGQRNEAGSSAQAREGTNTQHRSNGQNQNQQNRQGQPNQQNRQNQQNQQNRQNQSNQQNQQKTSDQRQRQSGARNNSNQSKQNGSNGQGQQRNQKNQPNQQRTGQNQQRSHLNLQQKPKPPKQKPAPKPEPQQPEINLEELEPGTKIITVPITVAGFAEQIGKSTSTIIMALMKYGIMANINQNIDEDTVTILGEDLGVPIVVGKVEEEMVEEGIETFKDKEEDLKPRPPIITVMGHVDHGKTSLLDAIRKTNVTSTESGGITQHIGASEVNLKGHKIVFLDTPGHEAFTAMRARGAHATDIAVLVVAADDSVKPQTIESISHAKAAGVPIIVAINKIDKPGANLDRVKQDLTEHGLLAEEWGGETICVPVSAKTGEGIVNLLEMILLQAEMLELKANPNRLALGTVIEARLDKAKGPVATLLVLNGTLQAGMSVVAGTCSGRVRAMTNFKGDTIRKAGPATAVEILGLTEVPQAGDSFNAVREDRIARETAENRKTKLRQEVMKRNSSTTLEQLFSQIQEGEIKELNLIIKGDVQGSVGALTTSLEKLKNENVQVKIIHTGVGTVTESDVTLAATAGAIIIAFNVRPSTNVITMADREGVEIRTYRVIYDAINEVEAAMKGMLDPEFKEVILGKIEIRNTFKVPGVGIIGGAYVLEGKVERNAEIRLIRDGIVVHEGKISSLKRFKDDAKEVAQGYECGIGIENYNDIKEGDVIEAFKMEEIERK